MLDSLDDWFEGRILNNFLKICSDEQALKNAMELVQFFSH